MNIDEILDSIESTAFINHLNLASDYELVARLALESVEANSLLAALDESPRARGRVLDRIHELSNSETDDRFENPWDVPLAVYVLVMHYTAPLLGQLAAVGARGARNTWWLAHVLQRLEVAWLHLLGTQHSAGPEPRQPPEKLPSATPDRLITVDPFSGTRLVFLITPYEDRRTVQSSPLNWGYGEERTVESVPA